MNKNCIYLCALCLLSVLCVGCSHIDDDERLIYVKPTSVGRNVLIEDFTGQNCLNCPTATQTIVELQEAYGDGSVVAVAIHSGDFGYMRGDRNRPYPLTTELGDSYFRHWGLSAQPIGMINRRSPSDYGDWRTQVHEELGKMARANIVTQTKYDEESRTADITVRVTATDGTLDGKLQLWLTEDSIVGGQRMPDGTWNNEYLHRHVFRDAVNGAWGTDIHLAEGETLEESFTYTLAEDKEWVARHMDVVAFVATERGVEQVELMPMLHAPADE